MPVSAVPERSPLAGHVHALDGVRGLAVLSVMLFHFIAHGPGYTAWPAWFRNTALAGWVGVDVFFVLSGFLITRILLGLRGRPRALRVFYARRALRIFPLYYAVVAAAVGVMLVRARLHTTRQEWIDVAYVCVYLTNINIAVHDWGVAVFRSVQLTHLWTLAIEEQFYLLWPLVVLWLPRRFGLAACIGLILMGPLTRVTLLHYHFDITDLYVLTPCRVDALAWGALIAFIEARRPAWLPQLSTALFVIGLVGVIGIAASDRTVFEHNPAVQRFGYTALAVASAGVVGVCAAHRLPQLAQHFLTARPLTALGRYSYAIYLFHLPLRGAATATWNHFGYGDLTLPQAIISTIVLIAASVGLAVVSFYAFEQWFLRLKPRV